VPITVVLGDDSLFVREGIQQLLSGEPDVQVVASCGDLGSLLEAVDAARPDVVITDIRMPPTLTDEGVRAAVTLAETHPEAGVLVLSQYAVPAYVQALLDGGSDRRGYLLKQRVHDRAELVAAIRVLAEGGSVIDPKIVETLVEARGRSKRSPVSDLTSRERDVLAELASGKSNAAIAESLVLSKGAVEKYINSIFMKLGLAGAQDVSKRVKATLMFLADSADAPITSQHDKFTQNG
jgi:DNA-binding NarL/FixJ family response regulator